MLVTGPGPARPCAPLEPARALGPRTGILTAPSGIWPRRARAAVRGRVALAAPAHAVGGGGGWSQWQGPESGPSRAGQRQEKQTTPTEPPLQPRPHIHRKATKKKAASGTRSGPPPLPFHQDARSTEHSDLHACTHHSQATGLLRGEIRPDRAWIPVVQRLAPSPPPRRICHWGHQGWLGLAAASACQFLSADRDGPESSVAFNRPGACVCAHVPMTDPLGGSESFVGVKTRRRLLRRQP
jgi:hypothetical protein